MRERQAPFIIASAQVQSRIINTSSNMGESMNEAMNKVATSTTGMHNHLFNPSR